MSRVLVLNFGSSSLKLQIIDTEHAKDGSDSGGVLVTALVERISEPGGRIKVRRAAAAGTEETERVVTEDLDDHQSALARALEITRELGVHPRDIGVEVIGHRVVHGGPDLHEPMLITPEVEAQIEEVCPLAPLHNPPNLQGIRVARTLLPGLPNVAVFDTGFFHTLPPEAYTYAIDRQVAESNHIRRYGFHGTSHQYVSQRAAQIVGRPVGELNQIVLHLGNGASASAVCGGRAIDTSMGFTPLEGLVMGTRPGDLDPGILVFLARELGMSGDEISTLLNGRSGLVGLSGVRDFRELLERVDSGDEEASLAYGVVVHRLRKYLGAYWAQLGRVDVISFTAGVGENAPRLRADAVATLSSWGVEIDPEANQDGSGARCISTPGSAVTVLVVPTNEELAIALACGGVVTRIS